MDFVWNDGGRAASGFVGLTGDCVSRSIAIATGTAYRSVYDELGKRSLKTPRNGVETTVSTSMLTDLGWTAHEGGGRAFEPSQLPKGRVIVQLMKEGGRCRHMTAVIDQVVHDTWNPADDDDYLIIAFWTTSADGSGQTLPLHVAGGKLSREQEMTQNEFEKILRRLRALDNTASNSGSTEGEKHNALRMMQNLMLTHNLSREDITDDDNVESVHFTRMACPLNGRRACSWEKSLANYLTHEVFTTVQWYTGTRANRTFFWFYGPTADVQNTITLFREMVLTIAVAAKIRYGGYSRGSGASYAEGYVKGLPRAGDAAPSSADADKEVSQRALVHSRSMTLHNAARQWLASECDTRLVSTSRYGRAQHDPAAEGIGKIHGSKHEIAPTSRPKRLTHR